MIRISQLKLPAGHSKNGTVPQGGKGVTYKIRTDCQPADPQAVDRRPQKAGHFLDLRRGHHIKRHLRAKLCVPQQK